MGKVYLIGAGPGDPDLITVRGLEILSSADVVLYDYLTPRELLLKTKNSAEIIYVGKRIGKSELPQDKLNLLIYRKARRNKCVVRLKGGDPYILGRGAEEVIYLKEKKIEFEIIPGVTSASGMSSYTGIPLTHRNFSSAVAIISGHQASPKNCLLNRSLTNQKVQNTDNINWRALANFCGTLVFYMPVCNLEQIVFNLIKNGRDANEPSAVVSCATTAKQRVISTSLANLPNLAKTCTTPALLVIGKTISLRRLLNWYEKKPLFGYTIAVCRPLPDAFSTSAKLRALGADAFAFPTITFKQPKNFRKIDKFINSISRFDWLLFMSKRGVEYFFSRLQVIKKDVRKLSTLKIGAIGSKTAETLLKYGIYPDLIADDFTSNGFLKKLSRENISNKRILIPRTNAKNKTLVQGLKALGANVVELEVYRTMPYPAKRLSHLFDKLSQSNVIIFSSQFGFECFTKLLGSKCSDFLNNVTITALGTTTANFIRDCGYRVSIIPEKPTEKALLQKLLAVLTKMKSQ